MGRHHRQKAVRPAHRDDPFERENVIKRKRKDSRRETGGCCVSGEDQRFFMRLPM